MLITSQAPGRYCGRLDGEDSPFSIEYDNIKNTGLNFAIVRKSWILVYKSPILY